MVHLANMSSRNLEISDEDLNIKHISSSVETKTGKFCFVCEGEDIDNGIKKFDFYFYTIDKEKF